MHIISNESIKYQFSEETSIKNTLKTHYSVSALIDLIVKQVKEIPDYLKLKQYIELILMICTMIETICTDSEVSIDKVEAISGV